MSSPGFREDGVVVASGQFATTHWSAVLIAGNRVDPGAQEALEILCAAYWYPLYVYVRRQGHSIEDAQDLTQEFFRRLLENQYLALADRERGRFRTFLLTSLQRFLISEWRRSQAEKRGGGIPSFCDGAEAETRYRAEPVTDLSPEKLYERRWAQLLLGRVLGELRDEAARADKLELFEGLKSLLWGDKELGSYGDLSLHLGMSEGALRIAAHRFRQRYRELLRAEIAQTVAHQEEIDEEMRHLYQALG
jgi:RNA polymerase sigma-70 factor (ECF subfamily)